MRVPPFQVPDTIRGWLVAVLLGSATAQAQNLAQGRTALLKGDTESAIAILERAVAANPRDANLHFTLGCAYGGKAARSSMITAARYAPKARGAWEQAVSLDSRHVDARFSLVEYYAAAPGFMGGSMEKAIRHAQSISAVDAVLGHRAMAVVLVQQKRNDLARQEHLESLRKQPNSPMAHYFFGRFLANVEKRHDAAIPEFETALKLDPALMPAWYSLGRSVSISGRHLERGEEAIRRYLAHSPQLFEPSHADARYVLGLIHEKKGMTSEARRDYLDALALDPSLKPASEALGRLPKG